MGDFHHDIGREFPEHRERIHELKTANAHFTRLFEEYHEVDKEIARIEQEVAPASDDAAEALKRRRLTLKDEIFAMLRAA